MSWPDDGKPRFVVATVTGFEIRAGSGRSQKSASGRTPPYCVAVLDRAYAYRIVREFWTGAGRRRESERAKADALAASLNAADRLDEAA